MVTEDKTKLERFVKQRRKRSELQHMNSNEPVDPQRNDDKSSKRSKKKKSSGSREGRKSKEKTRRTRREKKQPKGDGNEATVEVPMFDEEKCTKFVNSVCEIELGGTLDNYYLQNLMNASPMAPSFASFIANSHKNQSADIFCLESTRVKLKDMPSDYIHANWIKVENLKRNYIATQWPLKDTKVDFWSMIYKEGVEMIVSLTQISDRYEVYWPTDKDTHMPIEQYSVTCKGKKLPKTKYEATEYTLEVLPDGCSHSVLTKLHHYEHWPKGQVPADPRVVYSLLKKIRKTGDKSPIVVQCETGVNQTGVIIYCDALCSLLMNNIQPEFHQVFRSIRFQRASILREKLHFVYSIYAVLQFIKHKCKDATTMANVITTIDSCQDAFKNSISKSIATEETTLLLLSPAIADLII